MQKMEQALAVMREELEQEVQALSKSRSIEDRAARMAREVELNKVSVGGGTPPAAKRRSPALLEDLLVRITMSSPSRPCFLARDFVRGIQRERCPLSDPIRTIQYRKLSRISQKVSPSLRTHLKPQERVTR